MMSQQHTTHVVHGQESTDIESIGRGTFHDRLNEAAGEISYRKLGRLTDTHPETVRRYMQGQAPSATFLTSMCHIMGISGEWLLTGRGPMKCSEMRTHALSQADPSELLTAVANTLTDLCDRMDRLERYVQGLETKLNVLAVQKIGDDELEPKVSEGPNQTKENGTGDANLVPTTSTAESDSMSSENVAIDARKETVIKSKANTSAKRIGDAISKRPS